MVPPPVISAVSHEDFKTTGSLLGGDWDVTQEYDPSKPNDYEKFIRDRDQKSKRKSAPEPIFGSIISSRKTLVSDYSDDDEDDDDKSHQSSSSSSRVGAAIPPPKFLNDSPPPASDSTCVTPPHTSSSSASTFCRPSTAKASNIASNAGVSFVAAKIMTKMGYREGSGLGREEQGISRALEVKKTGSREGKILERYRETEEQPSMEPLFVSPASGQSSKADGTPSEAVTPITEIMKNPTKVVLLRNMVGPGEVDDDLEPETQEECSKYGDVTKCVIFEQPGAHVPPEDAVRIFVEFKRIESAIKAVVDLNGRFFGGRMVRAGFYDYDKFKRFELTDGNK